MDREENPNVGIVPGPGEGGTDPVALALVELWETDSLDGSPGPIAVEEAVERRLPATSALGPGQLPVLRERREYEAFWGRGEWVYRASRAELERHVAESRRETEARRAAEALRARPTPVVERLSKVMLAELSDDHAGPPRYDLEPLVIRGGVTFIIAPPASFKSFVTYSALVAIAEGGEWLGFEAGEGAPVLYLSGEGREGLRLRRAALEHHRGRELPESFVALSVPLNLREPDQAEALIATIRAHFGDKPPRVVAIDTVSKYMQGGDENGPRDTGAFMATVDRLRAEFDCSVILVHHVKKGTKDLRGHGTFEGAADATIVVDRVKQTRRVRVLAQKLRDDDEASVSVPLVMRRVELPESFGLRSDGSRWSSLVPELEVSADEDEVRAAATPTGEKPPSPKVLKAMDAIEEVVREASEPLTQSAAIEAAGVAKGTGIQAIQELVKRERLEVEEGPRNWTYLRVPGDADDA